jgi:hypothetical protein
MESKYIAAMFAFAILVSAVTLTIVFRSGWYI